jgi:hypothetical protein
LDGDIQSVSTDLEAQYGADVPKDDVDELINDASARLSFMFNMLWETETRIHTRIISQSTSALAQAYRWRSSGRSREG